MESRTDDFQAEFKASAPVEKKLRSFELYEEYSQRDIAETILARRDAYAKADLLAKEELGTEVEIEVENFHIWLELVKKYAPPAAHYYSVSLKSLLLGLPIGVSVAQLFDAVLEKIEIS